MEREADGSPDTAVVARLIREARAGDPGAFDQLILLHERKVLLTPLRLVGHRADAQDAAQEVFLRLHKHLGRFDDEREFAPWLYRVTVNVCRDLVKRRRRHMATDLEQV